MAGQVYFGTGSYQTWLDAPQTGMTAGSNSSVDQYQFLNGRSYVKRSTGSSRAFSMNWLGSINGTTVQSSLQTVKSFADGLYGTGPFYWLDPFAMSSNLMPPHWAAPMLGQTDWPDLVSNIVPTFTTNAYANDFPMKYATYALTGSYVGDRKVTIIIPATHTLNFGWHSTVGGNMATTTAGVRMNLYNRSTGAVTASNPPSLLAGGTTRTNATVDGATYSKVEIFLANGSASAASVNVVAMIAQVLLTGTSVATGGFLAGAGTTGIEFTTSPTIEYYSSAINNGQVGMSASFVEVD